MAKKTTQMSLIKYYPKEDRHINTYPREKGGKTEIVSEHDKQVHVKPELVSQKQRDKIKKGKAKKLIIPRIENIDYEKLYLKKKGKERIAFEEKILDERLSKSGAYKEWIKQEHKLKELEENYRLIEDGESKNEVQAQIEKTRNETNRLYNIFRVVVGEEIVSENQQWEADFYNGLSEADRYNFKTLEQIQKENADIKTKPNPFFKALFDDNSTSEKAPIQITLSENGEKVWLKWDNIGKNGNRKINSYRDDYGDFINIIRDQYGGDWEDGSFIINADVLENVLGDISGRNKQINYNISGKHNTQKEWETNANIQREILIENQSEHFILEVHGNRVVLKSGAKDFDKRREDSELARKALNSAYSITMKKGGKKETFKAVDINDDGEYIIPIGLLSKAYWMLKKNYDFDMVVSDTRERSPISNPELRGLSLYNFQKKAVLDSLIEGQGLIISPTGSGKTVVASGIISGFIEGADKYEEKTGKKIDVDSLFLVHRGSLRDQTYKAFKKFLPEDVNIGLLDSENFSPSITNEEDVNIGTIQGMYSALKKQKDGKILTDKDITSLKVLRDAEIIFQDEAHHIVAESYDAVYDQNKTVHKFGLTATPSRKTQEEILRVMKIGDKRIAITYPEAQAQGLLMKPNIIQVPIPRSPKYNQLMRDILEHRIDLKGSQKYRATINAQVEENDARNKLIIDHANRFNSANKKTIIFTRTRRHADELLKLLKTHYPDTKPVLLHGGLPRATINTNQDKLASGETNIGVGTDALLGEGFDLPTLDVILGAGSSQLYSKISVMQTAGRTMRVSEGKEQPLIFEYNDLPVGFAKRVQKRNKNYKEYNAFQYTPTEIPEHYGELDADGKLKLGDNLCKTKKEQREWVKKWLDPKESTNAEKFQNSEFYKHKRARGELTKVVKKSEIIKTKKQGKRVIPITERLADLTKKQVYAIATKRDVANRSKLKKEELINAIRYNKWQWDDSDRAVARSIAKQNQSVGDVFKEASAYSIKQKDTDPSQTLRKFKAEKEQKRMEF